MRADPRHPVGLALMVSAGLCCAAPAAAEPVPPAPVPSPAPPAPAELLPAIGNVLGQAGSLPAGPLGLPDLSAYGTSLLLGQTALPALPGSPAASVPDLQAFNPDYLLPLNLTPAAPGQGLPAAGLGPNDEIDGTGRIAFLRRIYEMYQGGALRGSLLGQVPQGELGDRVLESVGAAGG